MSIDIKQERLNRAIQQFNKYYSIDASKNTFTEIYYPYYRHDRDFTQVYVIDNIIFYRNSKNYYNIHLYVYDENALCCCTIL